MWKRRNMITPINVKHTNLLRQAVFLSENRQRDNLQPVRASIFYINDLHGKSINIERTMTASNAFDNFKPSNPTDKLKFSSGDILLGEIENVNKVAVAGENALNIMASAMGNHEYDMPKKVQNVIPDMKFKMLACNIDIRQEYPLSKKVEKSYIQNVNGHRYGVIGTSPTDLISRLKYSNLFAKHEIHNIDRRCTYYTVSMPINILNI